MRSNNNSVAAQCHSRSGGGLHAVTQWQQCKVLVQCAPTGLQTVIQVAKV